MFHRYLLSLAILLLASALSCGKPKQKINTKSDPNASSSAGGELQNLKDPSCTAAANCPAVDFSIVDDSDGAPSEKSAKVGESVDWIYKIKTDSIPGRLKIAARELPAWAHAGSGEGPGSIKISGTPDQKIAKGEMVFIVRDMLRCKVNTPAIKDCLDETKDGAFDTAEKVAYTVTDSTKGPQATPTPQSNNPKNGNYKSKSDFLRQ